MSTKNILVRTTFLFNKLLAILAILITNIRTTDINILGWLQVLIFAFLFIKIVILYQQLQIY